MIWRIVIFLTVGALIGAGMMIFGGPAIEAQGIVLYTQLSGMVVGFIWSMQRAQSIYDGERKQLAQLRDKLQADYDCECSKIKKMAEEYDRENKKIEKRVEYLARHIDLLQEFYTRLRALEDRPEASYDCNAYRENIDKELVRLSEEIQQVESPE